MKTTEEKRAAWLEEYGRNDSCPGCGGALPVHQAVQRKDGEWVRCSWGDTKALIDDVTEQDAVIVKLRSALQTASLERYDLAHFEAIREHNEYGFASLYMGEPRGKGSRVFGDTHVATERPTEFAVAIGIDLAYSAKSHADYSAAVVLARVGRGREAKFHVLEVLREQTTAGSVTASRSKERGT